MLNISRSLLMIQYALLPGFWDDRLLITNKIQALIWKPRGFERNCVYNSSDTFKIGTDIRQIETEKVSSDL